MWILKWRSATKPLTMINPPSRRASSTSSSSSPYSSNYILPISDNQFQHQTPQITNVTRLVNSAKFFLKKPHAFPFLLSIFLFLTWVSLRLQHRQQPKTNLSSLVVPLSGVVKDQDANLVRFPSLSSAIMKDRRGWLVDPVSIALQAGIPGSIFAIFPFLSINCLVKVLRMKLWSTKLWSSRYFVTMNWVYK